MNRPALVTAAAGAAVFGAGLVLPRLAAALERNLPSTPTFAPLAPLPERPSIEVVVPAYLEAGTVGATVVSLHKALASHAGESRVTVVASDAETASAARAAGADEVLEVGRAGKPGAANLAAERSTADVLVFTDANCVIVPDSWPSLVLEALREAHLVSGHKTERGTGEGLFWRYEQSAKAGAAAMGGNLGVVGEFLATRRSDYLAVPAGTVSDDLWLATEYLLRDRLVVIHDEIFTEEDAAEPREQWRRRTRIARGQLSEQIPRLPQLLRRPAGRTYVAHKLYRITVGNLGFWTAAVAGLAAVPPLTTVALPAAVVAGVVYAGRLPGVTLPGPLVAVGMQAVPPVAAVQVLRARLRGGADRPTGWHKIAR
ncbi:glycosyltransferase [Cellulomonas endophytica]|uniref:glycosyltransferase n=1 Tax=Cellulomonas endophytica TaxID=2494735 RepID=UPI0010108BA9|nr:glycosyltransferase [Cellulomonas endophytica]